MTDGLPGCLVGPSPEVLKSIREEMRRRSLTSRDRRMPGVAESLVAEPAEKRGLNEGIFYPETNLPAGVRGLAPSRAVRSRPTKGTLSLLVLLVDFSDNKGSRPAKDFQDMLFSKKTYATGSMHDFYTENSYGQLVVTGEVHGWIRLPQPYSYYVNGENGGSDANYPHNAKRMVEDALVEAAKTIDFRKFDTDGDGFLDGLFVIHAGDGAEADPNPATRATKIWSHQWNITSPFVSNGVTAYSYLTVPEDCRVGVCCHEFGHMLGLPDLYDTSYRSEGVGVWCVMGAGSWNNGGLTPGHFCCWAKTKLDWIKPTVVKTAKTLKIPAIETDPKAAYRLWTKGKAGTEYFLIENRQKIGFDKKLPASGLLVWRIDDANHNNNHPGDYWVGLVQADGKSDLEMNRNRGDGGDPYPGTSKKKKLDGSTTPDSDDHLGHPTGVSISGITVTAGSVSCAVKV